MIARICLTLIAIITLSLSTVAQKNENSKFTTGVKSTIKVQEKLASVAGIPPQDPWNTTLQKVKIYHGDPDSIDLMKAVKLAKKAQAEIGLGIDKPGSREVTPEIGTSMSGTTMTNSTPPDNTVAISNAGRIVAVDNEDISYFNSNGNFLGSSTHGSFFSGLTTSNLLYDPRVLYDADEDRFIYVLLNGNNSSVSQIFVCFSESNNPFIDGWHIYAFDGNPLNNNCWTDYPHIGITENELFITGNLFNNNNNFNQSIVWQIDKSEGYNGASVSWDYWDDIFDPFSNRAFSLVPASHGYGTNYGTNMYMVSNYSGGGNRIFLWEISGDMDSNPSMTVEWISSTYDVAADGNQAGSNNLVDVGNCRMQNAFYLNGIVHCVHASEYLNTAYSGVYYYRIPVDDAKDGTQRTEFGQSGFDYAYPSLASFGLNECDQSVMIGALRTGGTIFPEMRVMNCDEDMQWSNSTLVYAGEGPIVFLGGTERWGDYSAMQRKHNANDPEIWFSGCYPNSGNRWRTRIAEINGDYEPAEIPVASFSSSDSSGEPQAFITFTDLSTGNPDSWLWTFEGGNPPTSSSQNQIVFYGDTGTFDVKLEVSNNGCTDSTRIEDFITIALAASDTDTAVIAGGLTVYIVDGDTFELFGNTLVPLSSENEAEEENFESKVYPNPVLNTNMFFAEFETPNGAMIEVQIFDMNGRLVKDLHKDYSKPGIHRIGFNKLALESGQYFMHIKSNDQIILNEKVIVQH